MNDRNGTLLAKMGFLDKDRADPMHDAACAYVAANAAKVYSAIVKRRVHSAKAYQEEVLSKGSGKYKTTVGFVDVVIRASIWERSSISLNDARKEGIEALCRDNGLVSENKYGNYTEIWAQTRSAVHPSDTSLGIEVKWTENSVSDAIRQIAVYQSIREEDYTGKWVWALATPLALNVEQKSALESSGFKYIRLSEENVRAFAVKQRATPAASEMVL